MKQRLLGATCLASLLTLLPSSSRAEESGSPRLSNAECATAYERAQEQRKSGQLAAARDALRLCSRDECPDFIHADCLSWYGEIQGELPTLVFGATSQGRDLSEVTVTVGERVLATRLEGQVVELDPGEYDLKFAAAGMNPRVLPFVVARGERNRLVRVELLPIATEASDAVAPQPVTAAAPGRSLTAPAIFAGVALAGVGGFVALGAWGRSSESKLADTCSPQCGGGQVSEVRIKYVLADVSLGVGAAGLALAAYMFFRAAPSPAAPAVGFNAGPSNLEMTYGGRF